ATPHAAPPPIATLAGSYRTHHSIEMVCDPPGTGLECEQWVDDTMELTQGPDGAVHASVELVETNAHSCTFEGDLAPAGDRRWTFDAPEGEEGPCHVDLVRRGATLELHSE